MTSITSTAPYEEIMVPFRQNPLLIAINILMALGFYFGTHFIMTKKLNLQ
ncbi:MAG TPA: hypothetical protein PLD31_05845 [Streptococcus parasuis]|nr:hypothetical protein [Streptococcus parasuis]